MRRVVCESCLSLSQIRECEQMGAVCILGLESMKTAGKKGRVVQKLIIQVVEDQLAQL